MKEPMYNYREDSEKLNFVGNECSKCHKVYFPKRKVCKDCGSTEMTDKKLSGNGEIYSYTRIMVPPEDFSDKASYYAVVAKLDEGPKLSGILVDSGILPKIGLKVNPVLRLMKKDKETGLPRYQMKFEIFG